MAEYGKPAGRDILESLELRTRDLERRLSAIEGRRLLNVDRGTTTTVPAPVEGQVMVEEADEKLKWYANGQWREAPDAAGTYHHQTPVYMIAGGAWDWFYQDGGLSGFSFTQDLTLRFGGYLQSTAQNAYFIVGAPLGPKGARWSVDLYYHTGTDYGIFDLDWATTSIDATDTSPSYTTEYVSEPDPNGTWYNVGGTAANRWQADCYAGAPNVARLTQFGPFVVTGDGSAMLSANGSDNGTYWEMNGGGDGTVWWWLRLKVKDKHASSSGYRCRIQALRITRVAESGWHPF